MKLARGTVFEHKKWLNEDRRTPLLCEVTAVRQGVVFWRAAGSNGKSRMYFVIEDAERYVGRVVS